jgi:nucleotide-binding universal stress UspA family protein
VAKTPTPQPDDIEVAGGKGHATPTRKEREAANKRPLVPTDRKAASATSKAQLASDRERQRAGMAAGEERYLPVRDKGPQKRYTRDFVDARWNIGEVLLPLLVLVILSYFFPTIAQYALIGVWIVIAIVVVDGIVLVFQLRRRLTAKFGSVDRGVAWYAFMRAIQLRPMRLPKPQVKRGQYPS